MAMKYYDLLSTTIIGVVVVAAINYSFFCNSSIEGVVLVSFGYLVGNFVNAIGSLCEGIYYWSIGGKPSDKFLQKIEGQSWTGYRRVKFYETDAVVKALKKELDDPCASNERMFGCAMRKVNGCGDSRVPAFNAQYAWSRTLLTAVWIVEIVVATQYYEEWLFWVIGVLVLGIAWNRYKERGYYYAREVLNEYLKQSD